MPVSEDGLEPSNEDSIQVIDGSGLLDDDIEGDDEVQHDGGKTETESDPDAETEEDEETSEEPPAEEELPDNATIEQIKARYKNDPDGMAKAILNKDALINRQGNELGELRKQNGTAPIGVTPAEADKLPDQFFEPAVDPRTLAVNPDSGYLVHPQTGEDIMPYSPLGVAYIPQSYWDVREKQLSAQYPNNPAKVVLQIQNEQRNEQARYNTEVGKKLQEADSYAASIAAVQRDGLAKRYGKQYEEPVAKELANIMTGRALGQIKALVKSGQVRPEHAYSKQAIRLAIAIVKDDAEETGQLDKDIQQAMTTTGKKPVNPAKPAGRPKPGAPMPKPGAVKLAGKSTNRMGMDDAEYKAKGKQNYVFED